MPDLKRLGPLLIAHVLIYPEEIIPNTWSFRIQRATGTRPGDSVSRKKYPRLQAIIAKEKMEKCFTAEDGKLLMKAFDDSQETFEEEKNKLEATFNQERSKLETTFNADKKKMEDKRWEDIKDEIFKNGGNEYEGSALKAKYAELKDAELKAAE